MVAQRILLIITNLLDVEFSARGDCTCIHLTKLVSAIQICCVDQIDFQRPMGSSILVRSNMKAVRGMAGSHFLYAGGDIPFFVRSCFPPGPVFRR
jgi:hypothetical protein